MMEYYLGRCLFKRVGLGFQDSPLNHWFNMLQVVGDSSLVIECMEYGKHIHNINLQELTSQIKDNIAHFQLNDPPDKSIKIKVTVGTIPSSAGRYI